MARIALYLTVFFVIPVAPARAWSNQGHMATGAIAYDLLAHRDPAAVQAVAALMAAHPDRARFDAKLGTLSGAARARTLFELIARWPDDIRKTPYNHTHWHHQLRVVVGWTALRGIRLGEADHAFARNLEILRNAKVEPGQRAIALCWLVHIFGDMHQPLHAGHLMNDRFPLTDRAGTIGWVKRAPDAAPEPLHHFWDEAADRPGGEAAGADAIAMVAEATLAARPVPPQQPETAYHAAVDESERLAATIVYQGAALDESHRPADAPILSRDYVATAGAVADERLGQAGARLADMLAALFPAT